VNGTPNRWVAALANTVLAPAGFLYAGAPGMALLYLAGVIGAAFLAAGGAGVGGTRLLGALALLVIVVWAPVHAFRLARARPLHAPRTWYMNWMSILSLLALFFATTLLVRGFGAEPFRVPSSAMAPGLLPGDLIVVSKWGYGHYGAFGQTVMRTPISAPIARGDLLVFERGFPAEVYVKRVVGLPGDTVLYRDGLLTVNGFHADHVPAGAGRAPDGSSVPRFKETLDGITYPLLQGDEIAEAFGANLDGCTTRGTLIRCVLKPDTYFMLGDFRSNSVDSRFFGPVPARDIVGRVAYTLHAGQP
jgi:signal peptidase I